ncbi:hypothetical protein [Butyrivibrio sp. AE3004]|uniref:hypothetical protein n=1 Tax=Butyrivibrio sp. AE3004 TaxID=1506994 RepID=UPI00049499F6|nr:hypothetical protein [Butyrivibrio sp. AE3004]
MGKNWDYSKMAHNAKMNGGPEKYLELIRDNSRRAGKLEGKVEGRAEVLIAEGITFGLGLLGYAGYKAFTTIKDKRERKELQDQEVEVKQAEAELIEGIHRAIDETESPDEEEPEINEEEKHI